MYLVIDQFGQVVMRRALNKTDIGEWERGNVVLVNVSNLRVKTRNGWNKIPHDVDNSRLRRYYQQQIPKRNFIKDPKNEEDEGS